MRKESILISERQIMFAVAGQLFDQAPNRQPRNTDNIMMKVRDAFRKEARNDNEYYTLTIPIDEVNKFVKDLLMDIPEFKDLNLSQIEFEKKVSVDDESRLKYSFTSRYDVETKDSWKTDFIDLDAFIRNVIGKIYMLDDSNKDCFCCVYKESTVCNICNINPGFKSMYQGCRQPKGIYTLACQHNCYKCRYICCNECDEKDTCEKKCEDNNATCGQAINRIDPQVMLLKQRKFTDDDKMEACEKCGCVNWEDVSGHLSICRNCGIKYNAKTSLKLSCDDKFTHHFSKELPEHGLAFHDETFKKYNDNKEKVCEPDGECE